MKKNQEELQVKLQQRFDEMKRKNPRYSLRSFARTLGLSPATVSEFLNGKRALSAIAQRKLVANLGIADSKSKQNFTTVGNDQGHVIADWIYFALLSLMETEDYSSDTKWLATSLGVTQARIETTLTELAKLGFVQIQNGNFVLRETELITTDDLSNKHLRERHLENMLRAKHSLEKDDLKDRDFTFMTLAIDKKDLKKYKRMVRKFQDDIVKLQSASPKNCVYEFSFQIFPVST